MQNEDVANVKVGMFKQKTKRVHESLDKKFDFRSRCYKRADDNVRAGDFSKAMEELTKVDAKVNLNNVEKVINESLPSRRYGNLSQQQRRLLFSPVEHVDLKCVCVSGRLRVFSFSSFTGF